MDPREGFLVLSPNLGCPRLVAQAHLAQGEPLALLIASDEWLEKVLASAAGTAGRRVVLLHVHGCSQHLQRDLRDGTLARRASDAHPVFVRKDWDA